MNPIETFYLDTTVLITGSTGFIGTTLVEKLLRCFDVKKIYLLVRAKAGVAVSERHQNFLNLQIFELIKKDNPKVLEKLVPVEVDYLSHDLSIDCDLLEKIQKEVDVSFEGLL